MDNKTVRVCYVCGVMEKDGVFIPNGQYGNIGSAADGSHGVLSVTCLEKKFGKDKANRVMNRGKNNNIPERCPSIFDFPEGDDCYLAKSFRALGDFYNREF